MISHGGVNAPNPVPLINDDHGCKYLINSEKCAIDRDGVVIAAGCL